MFSRFIRYLENPLYRNSSYIVLSNLFNAACGFFFWMLAARFYSIEDVGIATALISFLGLIIMFSRLGFDLSIIRFFPLGNKAGVFCTSLLLTTVASIIMCVLYIAGVALLSPSLSFVQTPAYASIILLIVLANSLFLITGNAFVADRRADNFFYQNLFMALRIPLLIPLAFLGSFGILGSLGLGYLVASAMSFLFLSRSISILCLKIDLVFVRTSFRFSFWNYISNILFAAPMLILPILVLNLLSEADAAKYYIALTVANLVQIIPAALGTSLLVEGSHGEGLKKNVIDAGVITILILVPFVLGIYIFAGHILSLLKDEYLGAMDLLRILVLSSFLVAIYLLFIPIQNVRMKVESIAKLNFVRCVLLLALSYVFVMWYGIIGCGYAWVVTYGVIDLIIAGMVKKERWI